MVLKGTTPTESKPETPDAMKIKHIHLVKVSMTETWLKVAPSEIDILKYEMGKEKVSECVRCEDGFTAHYWTVEID